MAENPDAKQSPHAAVSTSSQRITLEAGKRGGQACVRGLRITVQDIRDWIAAGRTEAQILSDYPELSSEDIHAALNHRDVPSPSGRGPG